MKNFKKKKLNSSNGITLIALVITIIVLLILAGISISMLSGNNGILTKAAESKEETRGGAVQEQRDLWKLEQTSAQYAKTQSTKSLATLLEELGPYGQKLLTADEINTINETGQVTIGSRTIVFKEILTVGSEYDKGYIKIGDKLSYSANGASDWIVFGKDNDGNVLLTTETPVSSFTPTWTKEHWFTWVTELDTACSVYAGTIQGKEIKSRSIRLEDINRVTGFTTPTFSTYTFGTTKNYSTGKVNFFYPDETTQSYVKATVDTATVTETSEDIPAKEIVCDAYSYQESGNNYKLLYQKNGTRILETIDLTKNLKNVGNMKYVIGSSGSYMNYYVASQTIKVESEIANFYGAYVGWGTVCANDSYTFAKSRSNGANNGSGTSGLGLRPIVILPYQLEVEEISGVYDIK